MKISVEELPRLQQDDLRSTSHTLHCAHFQRFHFQTMLMEIGSENVLKSWMKLVKVRKGAPKLPVKMVVTDWSPDIHAFLHANVPLIQHHNGGWSYDNLPEFLVYGMSQKTLTIEVTQDVYRAIDDPIFVPIEGSRKDRYELLKLCSLRSCETVALSAVPEYLERLPDMFRVHDQDEVDIMMSDETTREMLRPLCEHLLRSIV